MLYKVVVFLLMLWFPCHLLAQKNTLTIATGLAWAANKNTNQSTLTNAQNIPHSLAGGSVYSLSYQYFIDSSHAILGISYMGTLNKNTLTHSQNMGNTYTNIAMQHTANQIVLHTGYWFKVKNFRFKTQIGAILPIRYNITQSVFYKDSANSSTTIAQLKHYFALGFNASISAEYTIQKNIKLYAALGLNLLNAKIKSSKITQYTNTNGATLENTFPTIPDREIHYLKNAQDIRNNKASLPNNFNKNAPLQTTTYSQSFSNIGVQFGFSFLF